MLNLSNFQSTSITDICFDVFCFQVQFSPALCPLVSMNQMHITVFSRKVGDHGDVMKNGTSKSESPNYKFSIFSKIEKPIQTFGFDDSCAIINFPYVTFS